MLVIYKLLSVTLLSCAIFRICESINNLLYLHKYFLHFADGLNDTVLNIDILRIANNIPFPMPNIWLNEAVTNRDISYYLHTRKYENVTIGRNLNHVNRKYPIKVLIHGWTEHNYVEWYRSAIRAYMRKGFYNVIAIDWSSKGDTDYLTASRSAKPVGTKIGEFLVKLHDKQGVSYKNMHLISHSLGCHVAGFAGKRVFETSKRKIARITGLDPAAPIFDLFMFGASDRLSKGDAEFVDIIHTDGGNLGINFPIGTADFFPNGGTAIQPGCSLLKLDIKYADCK